MKIALRSLSIGLLLAICFVGIGPGCGGGGSDGGGQVPPPPTQEVLVGSGETDGVGQSAVEVGDAVFDLQVLDDTTSDPIPGLIVLVASDGESQAALIIDETGVYPSMVWPVGGSGSNVGVPSASQLSLGSLIRIPSLSEMAAEWLRNTAAIGQISKALFDALFAEADDMGLGYAWGERVPLSDLNHEAFWESFGDTVEVGAKGAILSLTEWQVEAATGTTGKTFAGAILTLTGALKQWTETVFIYQHYLYKCYAPDTMVRVYRVGPLTINVIPEDPPLVDRPDHWVSVVGEIRDSETRELLSGVKVRLGPSPENIVYSDSQGLYVLDGIDLHCSQLSNWHLATDSTSHRIGEFSPDDMDLRVDSVNRFDFTLDPLTSSGIEVPLVENASVSVNGVIDAVEWQGAWSSLETFYHQSGGQDIECGVRLMHDGSYLYVGVDTPHATGWNSKTRLRIDGDNSSTINGQTSVPYRDLQVEKAAPSGWSGMNNYRAFTGLPNTFVDVTPSSGEAKASSGSTNVSYEFKVPLIDLGTSTGARLRLLITASPDADYMWYWPTVDTTQPVHYALNEPMLWAELRLQAP